MTVRELNSILNESKTFSSNDLDGLITEFRSDIDFFRDNNLKGPSVFLDGFCYEFAKALFLFLKERKQNSEIIFLQGRMIKYHSMSFEDDIFNPKELHYFHTIIKFKGSYFDSQGKLGSKRDILSDWYKFRIKSFEKSNLDSLNSYIQNEELVKRIVEKLKELDN